MAKKKTVRKKVVKKAARKRSPRKKSPEVLEAEIVNQVPKGARIVGPRRKHLAQDPEKRAQQLANLTPFGPNNKPKGGWTAKHSAKKNLRDAINVALASNIPDDIVAHYEKLGLDISGSTFAEAISALVMRRAMLADARSSEKALDQLLQASPKAVELFDGPVTEVDPKALEQLDSADLEALQRIRAKLTSGDTDQAA